jgi:type I restriction-modification system DNA methylase subunit
MTVLRRFDCLLEPRKQAVLEGDTWNTKPTANLRDSENLPLATSTEPSASSVIHDYVIREVRPYVDDAWIALDKTFIGYESALQIFLPT